VLTGGPCGGKSSALSYVSSFLGKAGIRVYTVPEAATLMMNNGVNFTDATRDHLIDTQAELCRVQLSLENAMFNIARSRAVPAVILSDRGALGKLTTRLIHKVECLTICLFRFSRWESVFASRLLGRDATA
jgi:hypothetical protein